AKVLLMYCSDRLRISRDMLVCVARWPRIWQDSEMIKLLIFDLDGTLFHTGPGIHEAVNVLFDRYQLSRPTYDKVISFIGGGLHNFMTHIGQETAHMKLDFPTLETEFRAIYGDLFRSAE